MYVCDFGRAGRYLSVSSVERMHGAKSYFSHLDVCAGMSMNFTCGAHKIYKYILHLATYIYAQVSESCLQ